MGMKNKAKPGNELKNHPNPEKDTKQNPGDVPMRDPYKEPTASGGKPPTKPIVNVNKKK